MPADEFYAELLKKESHYTLPVVSFIDGLDSNEVATLNKVSSLSQISLLSKPPKDEWLDSLIDRYTA